jgi:site-specific recombinase XerD
MAANRPPCKFPLIEPISLLQLNPDERCSQHSRKGRRIPFGQKTARALLRYVSAFRPTPTDPKYDHVFPAMDGYPINRNAISLVIARLRKTSGVTKLHAHRLRPTFAVNFLAAGGDLEPLRRMLGHESLEVTKHYLSRLQAAKVRQLYNELSPVNRLPATAAMRRYNVGGR